MSDLAYGDRVEFIGGLPAEDEEDRVFGTLVDPADGGYTNHPNWGAMVTAVKSMLKTQEVFWVLPDPECGVDQGEDDLKDLPFFAQRAELVKLDG
jgi:hypothetical protein